MADLVFNGDTLQAVHFNGDDLEEVHFNGDLIFQKNVSSELPVITSLTADSYVVTENNTTVVYVTAGDPTGNGLTYQWHADAGTFDVSTSSSPTWTAPADGAQVAHLYCEVTNTAGTVTSSMLNISVVEVTATLCSVTNPAESHLVSANGVVMGLQVEDILVDGNIVYRQLRYYAMDHNTMSGGYSDDTILMDWDAGVLSGVSRVSINGKKFGFTVVGGMIRAVSADLYDSLGGVSIEACGLSGLTFKFGLGHGIYLYTDAAGRFRLRYYFDSANDNYTKWFTPEQVEF